MPAFSGKISLNALHMKPDSIGIRIPKALGPEASDGLNQ